MIISTLKLSAYTNSIIGNCANCGIDVFESGLLLDDAYNVWCGKCPSCGAHNLLSMTHGLRGYDSKRMYLVLPTLEEIGSNPSLPKYCPNQGSKGKADKHGTQLGEILHQLRK